MTDLESLKSQYETEKSLFRTAMIQYETYQTEESREIFEEHQARMRGIFDELQTLYTNTMTKQQSLDQTITDQMRTNQQDIQDYQHLEQTASSSLDSMLAAYPMYNESILRTRLLYLHLALIVAGIVGTLAMMMIHSRTKPNTKPTAVNKTIQKNKENAVKNIKQTQNIVQNQATQYGQKALNLADNAVVQGQKQGAKVYNQALDIMFGKPPSKPTQNK